MEIIISIATPDDIKPASEPVAAGDLEAGIIHAIRKHVLAADETVVVMVNDGFGHLKPDGQPLGPDSAVSPRRRNTR